MQETYQKIYEICACLGHLIQCSSGYRKTCITHNKMNENK